MAGLGVGRLYSNWGGWLDTISITSLLIWLESIIMNNNVIEFNTSIITLKSTSENVKVSHDPNPP